MKTFTSFQTLMQHAHKIGQAKKSGDKAALETAQREHDEYVEIVRNSDGMLLERTQGALDNPAPRMRG